MDESKASPNNDGRGYDVYCFTGTLLPDTTCVKCLGCPNVLQEKMHKQDIDGSDFWLGILSPRRRHHNCAQCNRSRSAGERVLISIVKETNKNFPRSKSRTCGRNDVLKRKQGGVVSIRTSGLGAISEETELEKSHSIIKVDNLGKGSSRQNNTRERRRAGQEERYGSDIQGRIQQHKLSSLARRKLLGGYCEC
jgi:hypothetical protein